MNDYRVKKAQVPRRLYFVQHARSQTEDTGDAFRARDYQSFYPYPNTRDQFAKSVSNHLDWSSRAASPYISLMSDKQHAENFALVMAQRTGLPVTIHDINTSRIGTSYIFNVPHLRKALKLELNPEAQNQSEYLVLHRIPKRAIIRSQKRPGEMGLSNVSSTDKS